MAIPDFNSMMLPILRLASDEREHSPAEARIALAKDFDLTDEELRRRTPGGKQKVFLNRLAWALVHLARGGLIARPKKGKFGITQEGLKLLASNPKKITRSTLKTLPAYREWLQTFRSGTDREKGDDGGDTEATPQELLEEAYETIRSNLAQEILVRVKESSPAFFEGLVLDLLLHMGYGGSRRDAGSAVGCSGDEGIDGIISEDRLGLDVIYLQAKRWKGTVERPDIQKFVGALHGKRAKKGVFITTSRFSAGAREYVSHLDPKVILIDGEQLAEMMIEYKVGVSVESTYELCKMDDDYFDEE